MKLKILLIVAALVATCASASAGAATATPRADAKGGSDSPLIQRFAGSWLVGYKTSDWDQTWFPLSMTVKDQKWDTPLVVEGRLTRLFYVAPVGKSPLEVFRNYEQALTAAGFKRKFSCETNCSDLYFAMNHTLNYDTAATWAQGSVSTPSGASYGVDNGALSFEQGRMLYGTLPHNGQDVHVLLYTSFAADNQTNQTATFIQIVEPKAMPTGQVKIDAKTLDQGLKSDGKVALYGLYFDTGKTDIKPDSKAQLDEMAKLLQAQPALKVYIVGHTDDQGQLDANLTLSQQRAQAVVHALAADYKLDAKRFIGKGVANLAPVASNGSEDGRARNRRVELVPQ